MRLTLSQKEKYEELFKAIEILFNNKDFGLMYSEVKDAWVIGTALRDLLLFKNPPITEYDFYLQTNDKESIYPWLSRLAENNIPFEIVEDFFYYDKKHVSQVIKVSLQEFNVDYELNIIVGNINVEKFIVNNLPIATSLLYLDIADLFVALGKKESVEQISKKISLAPECKKDIKKKTITILKQPWMSKPQNYAYLESYLEKTHQKLTNLGFK